MFFRKLDEIKNKYYPAKYDTIITGKKLVLSGILLTRLDCFIAELAFIIDNP